MQLIRKLPTRLDKKGHLQSWAIFWCDSCKQEVEKILNNGLKSKSCGCIKNLLLSKANKGKKWTKKQRKNFIKARKGKKRKPFSEEWIQNLVKAHRGFKRTIISKKKQAKAMSGDKNPNWNNGSSFEPYSPEFNKEKKQQVLKRDNYTCQCPDCKHKTNTLHIHHIDYDKQNNSLDNLITLCNSCHTKTNSKNKRQYYTEFYKIIMVNKI